MDIRMLTFDQLKGLLVGNNFEGYRAKQIYEWIWSKSVHTFDEMKNLPTGLREYLQSNFEFRPLQIKTSQNSSDGTIKVAFELYDKHEVEGVLIPWGDRMTACISSQVGCSLACKFCATGFLERKRNLDAPEIYDQVVEIKNLAKIHYNLPLTNIVYMGMGEPLLNYNNTLESVKYITSEKGLGMSPKRITVSTAGIAKMIRKLGDDNVKFNLALSLHAANDSKRNEIMEINETNNLKILSESLQYFYNLTKNRITLEYIVFKNFNDTTEDARELTKFSKKFPSKINIIEYNPIEKGNFQNTDESRLLNFINVLKDGNVNVNVRRSRGKDIDAACGQLANKH